MPHLIDLRGWLRYAVRMSVSDRKVFRLVCVLWLWLAGCMPGLARAESLRCNGQIVSEGDTRLSVLRRCGQPALKDARCAPVYVGPRLQPLPDGIAALVAPCIQLEDWLYERGPGFLPATVRFRSGVVQAIFYGQESQ